MSVLNESDYNAIYNVAQCAGITNMDMSNADNALDAYTKIMTWVNNHEVLSQLFTAQIITVSSDKYRLELLTSTGAGLTYGFRHSAASKWEAYGDHTARCYRFGNAPYFDNLTICFTSIAMENLRLIIIRSAHGFMADLYDATNQENEYSIRLVHTTGKDDGNTDTDITFIVYGSDFYSVIAPGVFVNAQNYLANNATTEKTGLFTLMVPGRDVICENLKLCTGRVVKDHTFFEAGGKTWCCGAYDTSYKGLALCIE